MDIYRIINIVLRKFKYILGLTVLAGVVMFFSTRKQPHMYSAKATIFSGITTTSSLKDDGETKVDFYATKAAYNNLISIVSSRSVIEETSLRLLARHLMEDKYNEAEMSEESFYELHQIVPDEVMKLVDKSSAEKTYENLAGYMKQDKHNFLYGLINLDHPHYSYKALSTLKVVQVGSSDVIELSYQTDDAAISYQTLNVLIEVFLNRYSTMRIGQSNAVVSYFEKQLENSSAQLKTAEDSLLYFNKSNNIINYYEQTKFISSQQEKIDVKLQDVVLEYQAAEAVLEKLEAETKSRFNINLKNEEIMNVRRNLIDVNQKLAEIEVKQTDSTYVPHDSGGLVGKRALLERSLRSKIDSLYIYENNSDGIAIETLLGEWLKTVTEYESSKARLKAMKDKNEEFNKLYAKYAPLGAKMKRIEREIEVKEKAYLEILHHLGLAKLKQQSDQMMSNMKVLDKPQLPIFAQPTKRKLYVIIICLATFIFTILGLMIFEVLDKTVKTVKRLEDIAKIKVMGAYVLESTYKGTDIENLKKNGSKSVIEKIMQAASKKTNDRPLVVQLLSLRDKEGKSFLADDICTKLKYIGYNTKIIDFKGESTGESEDRISFNQKQGFITASYDELIQNNPELNGVEIILAELPGLGENIISQSMISSAAVSFMIVDAYRTWSSSDEFLLGNLKKQITDGSLYGILNKVSIYNMEELAGEVPKKRSKIRKFIKQRILKRLI
jgi:polysaccharide biosynthesis transport protein